VKKILLAGGGGYIGSLLTKELTERKYDVTVVDLFWFGNYLPKNTNIIQKNVIDLKEEELKGYDAVVFMGGVSNDPMADYSPSVNFVENCAVPSYLAYMTKRAKVKRFIYASSCSVYGYTANKLMDETSPVSPRYPYGISKLAVENSIMNMEDKNFRPISLRKGTVGGFSPRMRYDLVVNAMTKTALTKGKIVVNNPSLWRPIIDIRDVVTAYIRAIESNLDITGIYNISYDNYTIGRLADEIKDELLNFGYEINIETKNVKDVRNYKVSKGKAKIELDFVAKYSPRDSVREILTNIDLEAVDFSDEKYYNIQVFKELF
jgi:nucleoside-diphosphate-sugar epimerase|tara:strand:+ start:27040 stop:27996 length:957 start_codon:yes stop_codon:yes gene_type:complete